MVGQVRRGEQLRCAAQERVEDPWVAFETLLYGYLRAEADTAFRFALLGPQEPSWNDIAAEKTDFSAITESIVRRAVDAGGLREDFRADDFVLITRGAMANMSGAGPWPPVSNRWARAVRRAGTWRPWPHSPRTTPPYSRASRTPTPP
jgi:hypothetical protein